MAIRVGLGEMRGSGFPAHVMLAEPIRATTNGSDGLRIFKNKSDEPSFEVLVLSLFSVVLP